MGVIATPAVVVGGDVNGLGVVRSLARGRVPTILLDRAVDSPAMRTRFAQKRQLATLEGEGLIDELLALRHSFAAAPVLFLTQERSVFTAARHLDSLRGAYRFTMAESDVLQPLMHKASFQELAARHGFPIPRGAVLRGAEDLIAARGLDYPCVLKPAVKSDAYDARFKKAYKVESFAEAEKLFHEIAPVLPDLIVQEWIEGGDDSIFFCLQYRGQKGAVASFTGRKIRSWPPRVGGTASCMPAAAEDAEKLERLTNEFFAAAGFVGMGSMEYKRDTRTGRVVMIEPTVGRTDFQEEVATLNGVNIPLAAYCHELGLALPAVNPPHRPAVWAVSRIDRWSRELQPDNNGDFPREANVYDAMWRSSDPGPWLCTMMSRIGDFFPRMRLQVK